MAERKTALAVGAHPDDVEFMSAGTLALLADAGYEPHILTVGNGSCGTAEHTQEDIIRIRREEAHKAAGLMSAVYHEGVVNDIEIFYDEATLRKVTAIVREIKPHIVLAPSPNDYMEDHTNSCRLIVSACFCRGMRNWISDPALDPYGDDVFVYHANPYGNRDGMRNLVMPELFVDVGDKIQVKGDMLRCHESQKKWLDVSQGMDSYIHTMEGICRQVAAMYGNSDVEYAEGFRRHLHLGMSAEDGDPLSDILGDRVKSNYGYLRQIG